MRVSLFSAGVLIGTLCLSVGCSQSVSPTTPTAGARSDLASSSVLPAAAQTQVPFKGTMEGVDSDSDFTSTSLVVTTDGTGISTQLGKLSFTQRVTLFFATLTTEGSAHWTAANGDSIDTTVAGSGHPTAPNEFSITDIHTITGGTGRFAGAQGSFTVQRVASGETFLTSGSFQGAITSPGANH